MNIDKIIRCGAYGLLICAMLMFIVVIMNSSVQAETDGSVTQTTVSAEEKVKQEAEAKRIQREKLEAEKLKKQEAQKKQAEARQEKAEKLDAKRLEMCQKKESVINANMDKIVEMRGRQVEVFGKITDRTKAFYADKKLQISNYDSLVSDIEAKRLRAESALASLKAANIDFDCTSDSPLKMADVFKGARQEMYISMKEYRTSIKNLIKQIKAAAATDPARKESTE